MNRAAYDSIVSDWDDARTQLSVHEERLLEETLQSAEPGSAILDLGCGSGRPIGEYLLGRGFLLSGGDQSPRMLGLARPRWSRAQWVDCSLEAFTPQGRY